MATRRGITRLLAHLRRPAAAPESAWPEAGVRPARGATSAQALLAQMAASHRRWRTLLQGAGMLATVLLAAGMPDATGKLAVLAAWAGAALAGHALAPRVRRRLPRLQALHSH